MNTITIEKKWSGENLTNRTGGDGPATADRNDANQEQRRTSAVKIIP